MQAQQTLKAVRVWDLPTRLFHWLLAASIVGSFVSVKIGGNAMIWHGRFGFIVLSLLLFRILWGFIGPTHARFSQFVKGPTAIQAQLRQGDGPIVGHSPLGALSVMALLGIFFAQAGLGLLTTDDIFYDGPLVKYASSEVVELASSLHHATEWALIGLVCLHIGAIGFYALVKKRNLVAAMVRGDQAVAANLSVKSSQDDTRTRLTALVLLVVCASLVTVLAYA